MVHLHVGVDVSCEKGDQTAVNQGHSGGRTGRRGRLHGGWTHTNSLISCIEEVLFIIDGATGRFGSEKLQASSKESPGAGITASRLYSERRRCASGCDCSGS